MKEETQIFFERVSALDNHYMLPLKVIDFYPQNGALHKRAESNISGTLLLKKFFEKVHKNSGVDFLEIRTAAHRPRCGRSQTKRLMLQFNVDLSTHYFFLCPVGMNEGKVYIEIPDHLQELKQKTIQ